MYKDEHGNKIYSAKIGFWGWVLGVLIVLATIGAICGVLYLEQKIKARIWKEELMK